MQYEFYERYINGLSIPEKIIFGTDFGRFKYIPSPYIDHMNKDLFSRVAETLNTYLPYVSSYKDLYLEYSYDRKTKIETYTTRIHKPTKELLTSLCICESDILVIDETNFWVPMTDKMKELVSQLQDEINLFRRQI